MSTTDGGTKWTKGPWSFDPINTELVIQENSDPYTYVAEIWYDDPEFDGVSIDERKANASLIIAAPDMYEALEKVALVLHPESFEYYVVTNAMLKARGESKESGDEA